MVKQCPIAITLNEEELEMLIDFHQQMIDEAIENEEYSEVKTREYRMETLKQLLDRTTKTTEE